MSNINIERANKVMANFASHKSLNSVVATHNANKANYKDVLSPVGKRVVPNLVGEKFVFTDKETGFSYAPTKHAINQIAQKTNLGSFTLNKLFQSNSPKAQSTLKDLMDIGFEDLSDKEFLFRLNDSDNTCRAFMSDRYAVINNDWVLEQVGKYLPADSLNAVAKDMSTEDFLSFQVFIPNTMTQQDDSNYGGMLKITNSEIGTHRLIIEAGVFRLICSNGAIGFRGMQAINLVHRGKVDMSYLSHQIQTSITNNIGAMPKLLQQFTAMKGMVLGSDGASMTPLFASVAQAYKLTALEIEATHTGWGIERNETPQYAKTLFGIANSLTRGSQRLPESSWNKLNEVGGALAEYNDGDWKGLQNKANALTSKDVESILGKDLIFA